MKSHKEQIRKLSYDFSLSRLNEEDLHKDPFAQFESWFNEAVISEAGSSNAMTLCTVSKDGMPSARILLLRDFCEKGFTFYTNYASQKARELHGNSRACLLFFWPKLERQVRINGSVHKQSEAGSNEYFAIRPRPSKLGAWASPQSQEVSGRKELDELHAEYEIKFKEKDIPRPPHWGGYILKPVYFEYWQGRPGRFHDRLTYRLKENNWMIKRIAP